MIIHAVPVGDDVHQTADTNTDRENAVKILAVVLPNFTHNNYNHFRATEEKSTGKDKSTDEHIIGKDSSNERMMRMERDVSDIKNSLTFICEKYDKLCEQVTVIKELKEIIHGLKSDLDEKNNIIENLQGKIHDLEQEQLNKTIDIVGVKVNETNDCINILNEVATKINVENFSAKVIDDLYYIPNRKEEGRGKIVVKFLTKISIEQWLSKRKNLNNTSARDMSPNGRIFINESLSKFYSDLFWKTKSTCKEKGYKFVWVKNGKIFIKKGESSAVTRIKSEKDITRIF